MIYRNQWLVHDAKSKVGILTLSTNTFVNTELKDAKMMVLELFFMKT